MFAVKGNMSIRDVGVRIYCLCFHQRYLKQLEEFGMPCNREEVRENVTPLGMARCWSSLHTMSTLEMLETPTKIFF